MGMGRYSRSRSGTRTLISLTLNPRQRGVGTVNRHEGSSVRTNDTTPTRPPASDSRTGVVLTGGRTLVVPPRRRGDAPDPRHPATADPRSANPRLCVIRCDPRPAARVAGARLGHQFPEPGQPRPGEPTPDPPISFTSQDAQPDSGETQSLLPRSPWRPPPVTRRPSKSYKPLQPVADQEEHIGHAPVVWYLYSQTGTATDRLAAVLLGES
jgi:hypothetical protein